MSEPGERNPLDVIAEEYAREYRAGVMPSVDSYIRKYPKYGNELRDLLSAIAMMEKLKNRKRSNIAPEQLGTYKVVREIARGGMGVVFEAQDTHGRKVALKVLHAQNAQDNMRLERFRREAEAASKLKHPNIVPILEIGQGHGLQFFAMKFIAGRSLGSIVSELKGAEPSSRSRLPSTPAHGSSLYWRWAASVAMHAARALDYAHSQGILHRDIKPGNIMVDSDGITWVVDFGLAKVSGHEDLTQTGDVLGTLEYLAPEAWTGQTDSRSDVFGLGATLFELLGLRSPFTRDEILESLKTQKRPVLKAPSVIWQGVPAKLQEAIFKAIALNPADRFQDAASFAVALNTFLNAQPKGREIVVEGLGAPSIMDTNHNLDTTRNAIEKTKLMSVLHTHMSEAGGHLVRIHPVELGQGVIGLPASRRIVIGREIGCDLVLEDKDVSRQHAVIECKNNEHTLCDLCSTNGVLVNDKRIERVVLASGDMIRIGKTIFKYLRGNDVERQYHETVFSMMINDGLTGVPNKRFLMESLKRELTRSMRHHRPLSVAIMDLDHFKSINDTHGHLAGDNVLKAVSSRIVNTVRGDEVFARYGGEEFVIVLPESTLEEAMGCAERIRVLINSTPVDMQGNSIPVSVSIGVAHTNGEKGLTPETFIARADQKLYQAKSGGRDRVVG